MENDEVSPAQRAFWQQQTAMRMMQMLPEEKSDAEAVLMYVRQLAEDYFDIPTDNIPRPRDIKNVSAKRDNTIVLFKAVD